MSAAGDAQSDVMSGATLALMVLLVAILLYLLLLLVVFADANTDLRETLDALKTEEQLRVEEEAMRAQAETALESTSAALAAAEQQKADLAARKAKAEASQRRFQRAMEEAAGRDLAGEEIDALAEVGQVRDDLARCAEALDASTARATAQQEALEESESRRQALALQVALTEGELSRAEARAAAASEAQEKGCAACATTEASSDGNLVATGLKLWVDGPKAIITDAQPQGRTWQQRYSCERDERKLGNGGGRWRGGGSLGQ